MNRKIGEALLERGLITPDQLGAALQAQSARGGRLGVNLLELGMIGERELGRALGELLRTRYASPELLREVDRDVLRELPRELIVKHRALPLKREDNTLHLVVPSLDNLSGLSRATGFRIIPWIAPEVRVARELERHFDIPMDARLSGIAERLESQDRPVADAERAVDRPAAPTDLADEAFGYGRSWRDVAGEIDVGVDIEDGEILKRQFCGVDRSEEAVRLLLDRAARRMANCLLFRVSNGAATIWDQRSPFIDDRTRASVSMPLASGSMLELLAVRPFYRGPVPRDRAYAVFFTQTGLPLPREILLVPVRVANRTVAVLYGDGGIGDAIGGGTEEHLALVRRFALALTLIVIKNKIMR